MAIDFVFDAVDVVLGLQSPDLSIKPLTVNNDGSLNVDGSALSELPAGDFYTIKEVAEPATPATGFGRLYAKAGGNLFWKDDAGVEVDLTSSAGSPLTTKGDLFTYDTGDQRLGVGADGQVLTADSAEATGLKWSTGSAGDVVGPASATDNALARFDTGTGKLIQNSGIQYNDASELILDNTTNQSNIMTDATTNKLNLRGGATNIDGSFVWLHGNGHATNSNKGHLGAGNTVALEWDAVGVSIGNYVDFNEASAPATPSASAVRLYGLTNGYLHTKDDGGNERQLGSPLTTNGDLFVYQSGPGSQRLAVGANGETLVADSTVATGLKWDKPSVTKAKTADESVINSTTLQDDDDLFFDIKSGETWVFSLMLFCSEDGNNPNIQLRMGATGGLTGSITYMVIDPDSSATEIIEDFTSTAIESLLTSKKGIMVRGSVTATADGTCNFQWAQANLDAVDNTIVHAKSTMTASRA